MSAIVMSAIVMSAIVMSASGMRGRHQLTHDAEEALADAIAAEWASAAR